MTKTIRRVLSHIASDDIWHNSHNASATSATSRRVIAEAIDTIWDGSDRTAQAIAAILTSLKPAIDLLTASAHDEDRSREA